VDGYVAKYRERIEAYGWTLDQLERDYPHVIRVTTDAGQDLVTARRRVMP